MRSRLTTAAIALACVAGILVCTASASASTPITHSCPNPHIAKVSALRAGYLSGAYSNYAADCTGAKSSAQAFVTSKCAEAKYLFRWKTATKLVLCAEDAYDKCVPYKIVSTVRKLVTVACQPTHNLNAVITFNYNYTGVIPKPPAAPTGVNNAKAYSSCVTQADEANSPNPAIVKCSSLLNSNTCSHVLKIEKGSIACATAMEIGEEAQIYSVETSQTYTFPFKGYQCYASDQGTLCNKGNSLQFDVTG
jgi:hypothetical protein